MKEPILKEIDSITISGFSTRTQNRDEFNEKTAKIHQIWEAFYKSPFVNENKIYGVYSNYESDANGFYTVTVGVQDVQNKTDLNERIIAPGSYLVFENRGSIPEVVIKTWQHIWEYFINNQSYQRNFLTDFELYEGKDKISIYIGIKSL
jgi:predicted transcriptional regulator YdeE